MKNRIHFRLLAVLVFLITLAGSACSSVKPADTAIIGDPEMGHELFENPTRGRCVSCHTLDGIDDPKGPSLLGISKEASSRIPGMSASEYLEQSILEPSAFLAAGYQDRMKSYRVVNPDEVDYLFADMISEAELDNLIAFLLTQ